MENDGRNISCSNNLLADIKKVKFSSEENNQRTKENKSESLSSLNVLNSKPLSSVENDHIRNISEKDGDDINESINLSLYENCEQLSSLEDNSVNNTEGTISEEKIDNLSESENVSSTNDDKQSQLPIKNNYLKNKNKVDEISRETQRLIAGNGHVRLPYHKPKQKSLSDFLDRKKHLLANASVTGSRKKLQRAWEMIECKELNVHKFYNNDDVADNRNNIDDYDTEIIDGNLTLKKSDLGSQSVNEKFLNKFTESKCFKLAGGVNLVNLSQSVKFKSLTSCDGDDGLLIIKDSHETEVKKQKFKKNLSSHSQARSHVLKHDLWKRVRAARESNLQDCPSSDEDEEEFLLNDKKKQDFEENAIVDEDEELYGDDEQEEESENDDDDDNMSEIDESKHEKKIRKNKFINLECEVEDDINESESEESNCDMNDQSNNSELDNSMSNSDSSVGIKTGVLNLLSSDSETVNDNYKNRKKKWNAVLSDSDSDDNNTIANDVDLKVSNLPFVDTDVASTQQLLEMCSGSEFCTQESLQENDDDSSDGFDSDVPLDNEAEQEDSNIIKEDSDIDDQVIQEKSEAITDFFDVEAELSDDEEGGWKQEDDEDEVEDEANEEDLKMIVDDNGEDDALVRDSLGKIYMRQMLDDDQRQISELQEMLLEDGNLHNDLGRKRKFQWEDTGDDLSLYKKPLFSSSEGEDNDDDDDDDNQNGGDINEAVWRKERHIRDSYLAAEDEDDEKQEDVTLENISFINAKKTEIANEAVVKGSFMMKKGSRTRAAATLMLVDSKKKILGKNDNGDNNSIKSLTTITAKASITNPFSYLLGNTSSSNTVSSVVESKLSTKIVNEVSLSKINNEVRKKKCSSILKAFLPLE
ncbi:MATH and LRR domain-containing protein PFE0570w-like isoform X2 [Daktulosphaira vitifoliae]|uniref:MATH and LRR domain-containing protein PFE0570w-like isoform X2 n=1 Tax=Daktulosphaira vitifoliae TaxID=58002 RepID=UPI0021AA1257|nr:MATH and LRR domain-containing protein PFE0570w-like isoform X2 [Daktulosphaira vitifoliae]